MKLEFPKGINIVENILNFILFVILNELLGEEEFQLRGGELSSEPVTLYNTIRPMSTWDSSLSLRMTYQGVL